MKTVHVFGPDGIFLWSCPVAEDASEEEMLRHAMEQVLEEGWAGPFEMTMLRFEIDDDKPNG